MPEDEANSEHDRDTDKAPDRGYRSFKEIKTLMTETFNSDDYIQSTALDILALYFEGQKTLYIESKVYCERY